MARYRIVEWKGIPSVVEALEEGGAVVRVLLSQRFQDLIDAVAMRDGESESEAYLDGWARSAELESPGDACQVARRVADQLEEGFAALVAARRPPPSG